MLNFLAQRKVTVLPHPPYTPDFAPAYLFFFPRLQLALKGLRFTDVTDTKERVTIVLREILQQAFADSFQQLYSRCQKYVVAKVITLKASKDILFSETIHRNFPKHLV